jgi:thiol-disulfide isomerase/thioredoxin
MRRFIITTLALTLVLLSAAPLHFTAAQDSDEKIIQQMEALALRIHLHNAQSGDLTIWPGGTLGTATDLKPTWPLGDPLTGWTIEGLGEGQAAIVFDDFTRPTLVNLWGSWCGPCVQEFPLLAGIALSPEKRPYDVVFVDTWDEEPPALNFLTQQPAGLKVGIDRESSLIQTVGSPGIPTSLLLDAEHRVIAIQVGNYTSVQAALFDLLVRYPEVYTGSFDPTTQDAPEHFVEIQPVDPEQVLPLAYGEDATGTISDETVQTVYEFKGQAGDVVTARVEAVAPAQGNIVLEPYVVLLAPDGSYLAESSDYLYESFAQVGGVVLPEDGMYRVVATRYMGIDGVSSGKFIVRVAQD